MFASIRRYELDPKNMDTVMTLINEGFVPILSGGPGFKAYCAVDVGNGVLATFSIFESQTGAEESARMASGWVKDNIASLLPSPPQIITGNARVFKVI